MAKTKIVVLQMKELIYTAIFAGFLILLIVLLIIMFTPSGKKDKSSDASTGSLYQPGVYHSQVSLGDTTLNIELVTDSDQIKSVTLVNLESSDGSRSPKRWGLTLSGCGSSMGGRWRKFKLTMESD